MRDSSNDTHTDQAARPSRPRLIVPPAPQPEYGIVLGVAVATFKDGTTWLQTAPEQWRIIASEVGL